MNAWTLTLEGRNGQKCTASVFSPMDSISSVVIMNYGFPGDVRNYDVAERLAASGSQVFIPHPPGIEGSEGYFSFEAASASLDATFEYCLANRNGSRIGIIGYCYSTLWVFKVLFQRQRTDVPILLLAPVFDWMRIRQTIDDEIVGGFEGFISSTIHGFRYGFYGVRADAVDLLREHSDLEGRMNLSSTVRRKAENGRVDLIWGGKDFLMDHDEIQAGISFLEGNGYRVTSRCLAGANHFFALQRQTLFERLRSWTETLKDPN